MDNNKIGVAIIGCGLIGTKRAKTLAPARLVTCADINLAKAEELAKNYKGCTATSDWKAAIQNPEVEIVVVATINNTLAEITTFAAQEKKHVLVEKPAARNAEELKNVIQAVKDNNILVRVGFNHRYHPALLKAKELVDAGELGDLMFIRGRYGHGGRIGYDQEWRADPALSGGGELLDQGVHLIDLSRWMLGDFPHVEGFAHTYYWNMPVEDNGFMMLRTLSQQTAFLHVSCTEWKNTFSFEIYGKNAKLHIEGLGGSYGVERLIFYKMLPQMGPPDTTIFEFPRGDNSWAIEFSEFLEDIQQDRTPSANLDDALKAFEIVEEIYKQSGF